MSNTDGDPESDKLKGVFTTLMADGDWMFHKGEYQKAIGSFTTALALKPDDKHCLVGRSKCHLRMGQPDKALRDADASLKDDKSFFEGLYQKAEALYYMAEFEFALVFYHRGQRLRPQVQGFRLGIQKAQEAIENSVGSHSSVKLEIKGDLSFLREDEERTQPVTAIKTLMNGKRQKTPKREKSPRQQPGGFHCDRKFLQNLMKDQDLVKRRTKAGEQLQDVLQGCLSYLDTCSEFWKQERPVCSRARSPKQKRQTPSEPARFLLERFDEIDAELTSGNAALSLKKAEETMKAVQRWSERAVPNKKEVLSSLHSCMGNAWLQLGDMDRALEHHQKDLELSKQCKLQEAMSRALDNIGSICARMGRFEQAVDYWKQKLPLCRGGLEETWLFHEMGWCCLELGRHEEARGYARRSAAAADQTADEKWQMNASVLVAQSELHLGNFESCVAHFERALTLAKRQEDDSAVCAIQKALDEANRHLPQ